MQGESHVIITMMTFIDTCVGEPDSVLPASLGAASFFVVLFFSLFYIVLFLKCSSVGIASPL